MFLKGRILTLVRLLILLCELCVTHTVLIVKSIYYATNSTNKMKYYTIHKIKFMTCMKNLPFSAMESASSDIVESLTLTNTLEVTHI